MRPKVQIVVPVRNAADTLHRCLDSLKRQTVTEWQAILVDDASEDNSLAVLREYAAQDERFEVLRREQTGGAAAARNVALERLSGEYTTFLDADDYWEPDLLEVLLGRAETADCDVVQCRFVYDYPDGKQVLPEGAFAGDQMLSGDGLKQIYRKMMTGINMNHVCMKLTRTELIKEQRFDTTLPTAEDFDFCVELFRKVRRYCFVDRVLYHYCRNENSITGKGLPFRERFKANRKVSVRMLAVLPEWGMGGLHYRLLTLAEPYIVAVLKAGRILKERFGKE